ncbi:hypothetical protein [Crocosphaera chwakensis]|uniref:Uncharacterized protein n=1 Tax=Crocosphaera chwakensis CCY0110 TaxID=391612 RepID=A3IXF7_9CHRO|nr:hypothetical protein [Crocosphaera chwakensis]EAZ88852.1 hypothetical protein CY0110_02822 [Crocosphaera chwakensis CCY0110]
MQDQTLLKMILKSGMTYSLIYTFLISLIIFNPLAMTINLAANAGVNYALSKQAKKSTEKWHKIGLRTFQVFNNVVLTFVGCAFVLALVAPNSLETNSNTNSVENSSETSDTSTVSSSSSLEEIISEPLPPPVELSSVEKQTEIENWMIAQGFNTVQIEDSFKACSVDSIYNRIGKARVSYLVDCYTIIAKQKTEKMRQKQATSRRQQYSNSTQQSETVYRGGRGNVSITGRKCMYGVHPATGKCSRKNGNSY